MKKWIFWRDIPLGVWHKIIYTGHETTSEKCFWFSVIIECESVKTMKEWSTELFSKSIMPASNYQRNILFTLDQWYSLYRKGFLVSQDKRRAALFNW